MLSVPGAVFSITVFPYLTSESISYYVCAHKASLTVMLVIKVFPDLFLHIQQRLAVSDTINFSYTSRLSSGTGGVSALDTDKSEIPN